MYIFFNQNHKLDKVMIAQLRGKEVWLTDGDWGEQERKVVWNLKQWKVQELHLNKNERPIILKDIENASFQRLTLLEIYANSIESVEALSRIHMPRLQQISLTNNRILFMRSIRKAYWPELFILNTRHNYICDNQALTESFLPKLEYFRMLFENAYRDQITNICFPAKLQTQKIKLLEIRSNKYSFKRTINRVLRCKWEKGLFW